MNNLGRSLVWIVAAAAANTGWAATVKFKDLPTTRLPYGEAITVTGDLKDFATKDPKLGDVVVADWAAVTKITVAVTVEGLSPRTGVDATITGTTWTVAVDQFPKNASVKFDFKLTVDLSGDKADQIVDALLKDDKFNKAPDDFFAAATGNSVTVTDTAKTAFVTTIAPMIKVQLPGFLAPADVKPVVDSLTKVKDEAFGWVDAKKDLKLLTDHMATLTIPDLSGIKATSTPSEAFEKLKNVAAVADVKKLNAAVTDGNAPLLLGDITAFVTAYRNAVAAFKGLVADINVSVQLTEVATVQDFAKYAGVDVGALYSVPAKSLRSFFTVNVYLGAVEDTPAPAAACVSGIGSSKNLKLQVKELADAQQRINEAKDLEKEYLAEVTTRQARLDALKQQNASKDQIDLATKDRDSAQQLAIAATAKRRQIEKTAAGLLTPASGRKCGFKDSIFWQTFQQRFSISGGVSIGDLSGQKNPPFDSQYAFVAGGGWRLNKYFRAFLGDLLYRNKFTDRVNHTLGFGFSIDFSALGNITTIFGKVK